MLHENKSDTDAQRQKAILERLLTRIGRDHPDLYYQPTAQIARLIHDHIRVPGTLNADDSALMTRLGTRDIEILLSLH